MPSRARKRRPKSRLSTVSHHGEAAFSRHELYANCWGEENNGGDSVSKTFTFRRRLNFPFNVIYAQLIFKSCEDNLSSRSSL